MKGLPGGGCTGGLLPKQCRAWSGNGSGAKKCPSPTQLLTTRSSQYAHMLLTDSLGFTPVIEVLTPSNDTYLHDIPCGTGEEGSPHTLWTSSGDDSWTTRTGFTSSTSSGCELQNKVIKTSQDTFYLHTPVTAFVVRHGRRRRQRQAVRRRRGGGRGSNRQWQAVRRRQQLTGSGSN